MSRNEVVQKEVWESQPEEIGSRKQLESYVHIPFLIRPLHEIILDYLERSKVEALNILLRKNYHLDFKIFRFVVFRSPDLQKVLFHHPHNIGCRGPTNCDELKKLGIVLSSRFFTPDHQHIDQFFFETDEKFVQTIENPQPFIDRLRGKYCSRVLDLMEWHQLFFQLNTELNLIIKGGPASYSKPNCPLWVVFLLGVLLIVSLAFLKK